MTILYQIAIGMVLGGFALLVITFILFLVRLIRGYGGILTPLLAMLFFLCLTLIGTFFYDAMPEQVLSSQQTQLQPWDEGYISNSQSSAPSIQLEYGELLDLTDSGDGSVIVKTKTRLLLTSKLTRNQNYFNVQHLITDHGFGKYGKITYWTVMDTTDGDAVRAMSFVCDKTLIEDISHGRVVSSEEMEPRVSELWILPNLQD